MNELLYVHFIKRQYWFRAFSEALKKKKDNILLYMSNNFDTICSMCLARQGHLYSQNILKALQPKNNTKETILEYL